MASFRFTKGKWAGSIFNSVFKSHIFWNWDNRPRFINPSTLTCNVILTSCVFWQVFEIIWISRVRDVRETAHVYIRFSPNSWEKLLTLLSCSHREIFNPLSANFTKWSNTLKQFVSKFSTNCLSVLDHSVGLVLKGLK